MLRGFTILFLALVTGLSARADRPRSPFGVEVTAGTGSVQVRFAVPAGCVLYADRLHFETADGTELTGASLPAPQTKLDAVTGHEKKVYGADFAAELPSPANFPGNWR